MPWPCWRGWPRRRRRRNRSGRRISADEIEAQIEQHIELADRQIEHLVDRPSRRTSSTRSQRAIEKHASQIEIKVQSAVLAQRQAAEAARRAAQQAAARPSASGARKRAADPSTPRQISKTLRLGKNGTFDLQNVSGDIVVTGGGGNDVRIEAIKRVRHPNESEAQARCCRAIEVRIEERNGNVEVRTDYPRRNWSGGVDYTVSLPRDANVVLRSVSGDVRVSTLNGDLRAETISGDLVATAVRRIRQAKTISGDLEIVDSDGDEVTGSTMSGTLMARGMKARSVDLQSVSGDLRMTDVESDRTFVRSISGNIDFSGRLSRNGRYEFQSHSGDVRVSPLGSQGFSIEASTFSGDLRSDYPLTLQGNHLTTASAPRPEPPRGSRDRSAMAARCSRCSRSAATSRSSNVKRSIVRVTLGSCVDQTHLSVLLYLLTGFLTSSAAAQTDVEPGAIAAGGDIGVFFPDEAFEKTFAIDGFGEYYATPSISIRGLFGWANPGFENFTEDQFRQVKLLFNGVYYLRHDNWLPYATAGAGAYFVRQTVRERA